MPRRRSSSRSSARNTPSRTQTAMWKLVQGKTCDAPQRYDFLDALRPQNDIAIIPPDIIHNAKKIDPLYEFINAPKYGNLAAMAAAEAALNDQAEEAGYLNSYFEQHVASPAAFPVSFENNNNHGLHDEYEVDIGGDSDSDDNFVLTPRPQPIYRLPRRNSILVTDISSPTPKRSFPLINFQETMATITTTTTSVSTSTLAVTTIDSQPGSPVPNRLSISELCTSNVSTPRSGDLSPQTLVDCDKVDEEKLKLSLMSNDTNYSIVRNMSSIASTDNLYYVDNNFSTINRSSQSTKPSLTVPKEFSFLKRHPLPKRTLNNLAKTMSPAIKKRLRAARRNGLTIPHPFKFHESSQRHQSNSTDPPHSPYVPLAIKVKQFSQTPERFKLRASSKALQGIINQHRHLTRPRSPRLLTKSRIKHSDLTTSEDLELAHLRSLKPFKAHPLNDKIILSHGQLGVPERVKLDSTVPHSPAITKPKPKFLSPTEDSLTRTTLFKAQPMPDFSTSTLYDHTTTATVEKRPITVPQPFHLAGDEVHRKYQDKFHAQIGHEEEERQQLRRFVAQPLPATTDDPILSSAKQFRPLTSPHSPNLATSLRTTTTVHRRRNTDPDHIDHVFHAQPVPLSIALPFVPLKSTKPLTKPDNVILYSSDRAVDRAIFDLEVEKKRMEEEGHRNQLKKEQELVEQRELRRLRSEELVHKAQPVPDYSHPMLVKPSSKPVTIPESPMIGAKRKRLAQAKEIDHVADVESGPSKRRVKGKNKDTGRVKRSTAVVTEINVRPYLEELDVNQTEI